MTPIRVLVVDDHPIFRDGLRAALQDPTIELVGEAANATEAMELAAAHAPDVILMDLQMPGQSGIDATRAITAAHPSTTILILTMTDDPDAVFAAVRAGARGYLLKGSDRQELLRAIDGIASGDAIFGPGIAERLLGAFTTERDPSPPLPVLTDRERDVISLLANGYTNPAIARELIVSPKTVRNHVSNILSKLQVQDRHEAARLAREAGLRDKA